MKLFITIFIASFFIVDSQAQNSASFSSSNITAVMRKLHMKRSDKNYRHFTSYEAARDSYSSVDGSPYLYKNFVQAKLLMIKGDTVQDVKVLFDIYNNEIIAKQGKNDELVLEAAYFESIICNVKGERHIFSKVHPERKDEFFEVLYTDDEVKFIKKSRVKMTQSTSTFPGRESVSNSFSKSESYYIVRGKRVTTFNIKRDIIFGMLPGTLVKNMRSNMKLLKIKKLKKEEDILRAMYGK